MPPSIRTRNFYRLLALGAVLSTFACLADSPQRPLASRYVPALPESLPGRGRGAIVGIVVDSVTGLPVASEGGPALYQYNTGIDGSHAVRMAPVGTGQFAFYNLLPESSFPRYDFVPDSAYQIKCSAPGMHVLWSRRLRITAGAVDTVVCLMKRRAAGDTIRIHPQWPRWSED